jgi:hypothetical protein
VTALWRGARRGEVRRAVAWFFGDRGPSRSPLPFYCDPDRIGTFAVTAEELMAGDEAAYFRLFVTLSMYQGRRDVLVMRQQRRLPRASMHVVADLASVKRAIGTHECAMLHSADTFEQGCDVSKIGKLADCGKCPGARCHVKEATVAFNRMADMGKLPTSAWLRLWKDGGVRELLDDVCRTDGSPTKRAALLVDSFMRVHRVGRKLATMFVSALSTPDLAPGLQSSYCNSRTDRNCSTKNEPK